MNKVDATMDEIRDQMDLANEISDAISQPIAFGVEFDEVRVTQLCCTFNVFVSRALFVR